MNASNSSNAIGSLSWRHKQSIHPGSWQKNSASKISRGMLTPALIVKLANLQRRVSRAVIDLSFFCPQKMGGFGIRVGDLWKTREREEVNFRILENMCNLPVPINSYFEREREESREFMDFARYHWRRISNLGYRVVSFRVVLGENRVWYVEKNRVWVGRVVKNKREGGHVQSSIRSH